MLAPRIVARTTVWSLLFAIARLSCPTAMSPPVKNNCSMTNGTPRTAVKGQPIIAPAAIHRIALVARWVPVGVEVAGWNQNDAASMVVYMAKLEGKKAGISKDRSVKHVSKCRSDSPTPALHIPADKSSENKTYRPTRSLTDSTMAR